MTTLTQGYATQGRECYKAGDAWEYLSSLPVDNPERNRLSDRVRLSGDALARRAHKYLTLAEEYTERKRVPRAFVLPNPVTRQAPCKPFESGDNVLPGMERWIA